jgi:exodeoxyribonuclease V alpha subunit
MKNVKGTFEHAIFSSEETGFTVARFTLEGSDQKITLVGHFSDIRSGEVLDCEGDWRSHPTHGKQFEVKSYTVSPPHTLKGITKYLESGMIRGVGKKYASRIVESFGLATLKVIDETPHRLKEVSGLGEKRVSKILTSWQEQKQIREVMIFFKSHGVGTALANKIFKKYGQDSIKRVKDDPYLVAGELYGVGFKTVDKIAKSMGLSQDAPQRIMSGIEFTLKELADDGHTCAPEPILIEECKKILEVEEAIILSSIEALMAQDRIIKRTIKEEDPPYIWLKFQYHCEIGIAKEIERLSSDISSLRSVDIDKAIEWIEALQKIKFADMQKVAIVESLRLKLHIITGGPGTGKSTITKAILGITEKITDKIILAAPTGRAAKRMSEITRKKASTIHSLLEFDFINGGFKKNKDNPIVADLVIIDEASMIDNFLMFSLLKAIPTRARVILIGDIDQLPSVGPGNVLRDLIDSEKIPTTMLTKIYRQGEASRIVINAHRINKGIFPDVTPNKLSDFHFLPAEDAEEILSTIVDLNSARLPNHYHLNPKEDIQVLSPMKKGPIGTENLNLMLQARLNPQGEPLEIFGKLFKEGDKVMQIRNNYQKNTFNGDVGTLIDIDKEDQVVAINFDGKEVEYDFSELDEVVLAYAVSVHKYQGSECKAIIMPIHPSHYKLLYRNLLYTGITRGKKLVVLVGSRKAIHMAIGNDHVKKRYTALKEILNAI